MRELKFAAGTRKLKQKFSATKAERLRLLYAEHPMPPAILFYQRTSLVCQRTSLRQRGYIAPWLGLIPEGIRTSPDSATHTCQCQRMADTEGLGALWWRVEARAVKQVAT
jgi:hypothetical protein